MGTLKDTPYFMVFDVESIGLHGEAFAVGWVVVDRQGTMVTEGLLSCDPAGCMGTDTNREWVAAEVPALEQNCVNATRLRNEFWEIWRTWADKGAVLVADCAWPVETQFMSDIVQDYQEEREWKGPYPLYDLASILFVLGVDPLMITERQANELPAHNPLTDARQSARQLISALDVADGATRNYRCTVHGLSWYQQHTKREQL